MKRLWHGLLGHHMDDYDYALTLRETYCSCGARWLDLRPDMR